MNILLKYFPNLSETQKQQFARLQTLYAEWNGKINVISRKDIDNLYERHILHSLAIARVYGFRADTTFIDIGTGGGFPGIPMAILLPDCQFLLVDSIGKKVRVAREVATAIGLRNVDFRHARAEEVKEQFDFAISRAVMPLADLVKVCRKNIARTSKNAIPNGLICLKGGDMQAEVKPFARIAEVTNLADLFEEAFFETKKVVYVPL